MYGRLQIQGFMRSYASPLLLIISPLLFLTPAGAQTSDQKPAAAAPTSANKAEERPEAASSTRKPDEKPAFTLQVAEEHVLSISLQAEGARLSEIAAELSRKLKIPVALSPVMVKQKSSAKFSDLLLEPAMQLLAPVVFIDYQVDSVPGARPRPLGVFLFAYNEQPPALDAVVKGKSQAFVISGNTESNGEDEDDDSYPIKTSFKNGNLTAKAKDQPLVEVMFDIAEEAGIPFEAPQESKELVTVNIKDRPLEEAVLEISPNIRLFVRADLFHASRTVLRIVVVEREKNP